MNKKIALVIFYFGVTALCAGVLLFASLVLNYFGYDFKAFSGLVVPPGIKITVGLALAVSGIIIARLAAKPAGRINSSSSFMERFKIK